VNCVRRVGDLGFYVEVGLGILFPDGLDLGALKREYVEESLRHAGHDGLHDSDRGLLFRITDIRVGRVKSERGKK
jgi:hypothetical protein